MLGFEIDPDKENPLITKFEIKKYFELEFKKILENFTNVKR